MPPAADFSCFRPRAPTRLEIQPYSVRIPPPPSRSQHHHPAWASYMRTKLTVSLPPGASQRTMCPPPGMRRRAQIISDWTAPRSPGSREGFHHPSGNRQERHQRGSLTDNHLGRPRRWLNGIPPLCRLSRDSYHCISVILWWLSHHLPSSGRKVA